MLLTVDTGTTNTRVHLLQGEVILAQKKVSAGVRNTAISGNADFLRQALRDAITDLLKEAAVSEREVSAVLASGMITSNLGLYELPHVSAPVSLRQLAKQAVIVRIPEVCEIPFFFIPGVRNQTPASIEFLDQMDMMRGEETEALGMLTLSGETGPLLAVLPGSHTKLVEIGAGGQILSCETTLSGEMLAALSQNTILKDSVQACGDFDADALCSGFAYSREHGLNKACFRVRLMDVLLKEAKVRTFSFLAGAVLAGDIGAISAKAETGKRVLIGGTGPLHRMFLALLEPLLPGQIVEVRETDAAHCTVYGALAVWRCRNE